jgi:hypothetical protein
MVVWLLKALVAVLCAVLERIPLRLLIAGAVCITAALLVVSADSARADVPKLVPDGQFESEKALGVAVDNSASEADPSRGDVYVAGFLNFTQEFVFKASVNKFDGSGNLLSPPSPIGVTLGYSGAAVDPVKGVVYALDIFNNIDKFDPTSGGPLGSFPVESSRNYFVPFFGGLTVVGIAADSEGNVYVPVVPKNEVVEYSSGGEFVMQLGKEVDKTKVGLRKEEEAKSEPVKITKEQEDTCTVASGDKCAIETSEGEGGKVGSGGGEFNGPTGVAVDSAGNLWVADTGNNRIEKLGIEKKLSPSETVVRDIGDIPAEGVRSVAVDALGDVFAIVSNSADFCGAIKPPCSHLAEYNSAGALVADLGAGVIGARQNGAVLDMVAVSDATGRVYVTEVAAGPSEAGGRVLKFRPPVAPRLEGEAAVEVGVSGAKLGVVVNPGGLSASYRFEYDTSEYKEGEGPHGRSVPLPAGDTGAGFLSRTVWAGVSGLQPGTTYHYRAVVSGALGKPLVGKDQTFTTATVSHAACPNEQFRTGFSAYLPDCRAYELVTPPNKDSAQPDKSEGNNEGGELTLGGTLEDNLAAVDGNRLSFRAEDVLPGSPSAGESYVATRGSGGWSSENMFPPTNAYAYKCTEGLRVLLDGGAYSEDLSKAIIRVKSAGDPCGVDPELVEGEPRGSAIENLFVRDNATGAYQLVDAPEAGVVGFVPATPALLGESSDFNRIVFEQGAKLTKEAPAGVNDVYEWSAGHVHLATILPNGTPVAGAFAGVSLDGSRVFFTAGGGLYARVNGSETVQLDASQAGGGGGGGAFVKASRDGSVVFFTADASAGLTSDTVPGSGPNLYRYDAVAPAGQRLTDLTPVAKAVAPAVGGMSKDGSVVFFLDDASAALTPNTQPESGINLYRYEAGAAAGHGLTDLTPVGIHERADVHDVIGVGEDNHGTSVYFRAAGVLTSQANQHGEMPQHGQGNMYLSRGSGSAFIATGAGRLRVSGNGGFLLFDSSRSLTGYDNINPGTGKPANELYLYDAAANSLACASCNPSGESPTASGAGVENKGSTGGGAIEEGGNGRVAPHQLSENGQVFFDSAEGLLPADTNGRSGCPPAAGGFPTCTDVYEFEPDGAGSCAEPAGCLSLISTGTGSLETFFIDASPNGNDVFIREFQKLLPSDTQDEAPSLYDVRVNGGFPEPTSSPCTNPEACRTAPAPLPGIFGAPASQTFSGAGNLQPAPAPVKKHCKKGFVEKKGKCMKKKPRRRAQHSRRTRKSTHSHKKTGR